MLSGTVLTGIDSDWRSSGRMDCSNRWDKSYNYLMVGLQTDKVALTVASAPH